MKLRIEVRLDRTGETLASEKVEISTNPEHIRAAKLEAAVLVEDAVNVLLVRAIGPGEVWQPYMDGPADAARAEA